MPDRVVVANPGGERHLRDVAAAFAEVGDLDLYISTAGYGISQVADLPRTIPGPVAEKLKVELKRRAVTDQVGARAIRIGTTLEVTNVALSRLPLPKPLKFIAYRPARLSFDYRASRRLERGMDAVIGSQGTTMRIFARAGELGIGRVLDYPIAHYRFTEAVLEEEVRLKPDWAATMRVYKYPDWVRRRYVREIEMAERIIMVSGHHQQNFAEAGIDPGRTFIVPWYVDSQLFTPAEHEDETAFRVAFVGELSQRKGLSYLIDGFERAALPDSELLLIGRTHAVTGPWADRPRVRHVPPMPNFMLPDVLRGCHVIALPSLVEGFPVSILEGMACGLPAIISENIGRDIVEDGKEGFVVPIRDPDAIAERLAELHADTARRREMARAARAKAETFTKERNQEALRQGVRDMLAERRGETRAVAGASAAV
ncbi:MAG: glycosyltransferase [Solirubrobacteraceae bacterium]